MRQGPTRARDIVEDNVWYPYSTQGLDEMPGLSHSVAQNSRVPVRTRVL